MRRMLLVLLALILCGVPVSVVLAQNSMLVTWTCTGSPCPWGQSLSSYAVVWGTGSARFGYTTNQPVYRSNATGVRVTVDTGNARIYAGEAHDASHTLLASLTVGQSYTINTDLPVSIQNDYSSFTYTITEPIQETETPINPTLYPTPPPLTDGVVMDAMALVADETIRISATSVGMYILAPVLLLGGMHLLWGFIVRRRS